jgi:hypothetical protein
MANRRKRRPGASILRAYALIPFGDCFAGIPPPFAFAFQATRGKPLDPKKTVTTQARGHS